MTTYYYSASTNWFYVRGVHAAIPEDAVEISAEEHDALLNAQTAGQRITANSAGRPVAAEPTPPSTEQLSLLHRVRRDRLLDASDKRILADYPQTQAELHAWLQYRDALRRVPEQPGFPVTVTWPQTPD